jgi:hypothetical protein
MELAGLCDKYAGLSYEMMVLKSQISVIANFEDKRFSFRIQNAASYPTTKCVFLEDGDDKWDSITDMLSQILS